MDHRRLRATPPPLSPAPAPDRPAVEWAASHASTPRGLYAGYPKVAAGLAITRTLAARAVEADMTTDLLAAAPAGARLHGLEFRVKSPASLARKIDTKCRAAPFADPHRVAGNITDVVRYTVLTDDHDLIVGTARVTVRALTRRGWVVTSAEHSFFAHNPYKALHVTATHPGGETAEIQFHSTATQHIKDHSHGDYETARNPDATAADRSAARTRMLALWARVPAPEGIGSLHTLGGCTVAEKRYR